MFDDGYRGEFRLPILKVNWPLVNYLASELCWGCMPLDLNDPVYKSHKFKDMQDRVVKGEFNELLSLIRKVK